MQELFNQLQSFVSNNPILTTLTSGSLIVWLVTNLKNIWHGFVNVILLCISFKLENFYEDNRNNDGVISPQQHAYNEIISNSKAIFERTKNIDLSQTVRYGDSNDTVKRMLENNLSQTSLTFGFSIRIINGKIVFCERTMSSGGQKTMISTSLRVFFSNKEKFIQRLETQIVSKLEEKIRKNQKSDCINIYNGYVAYGKKSKRQINSIFTNDNEHIKLFDSIKMFIENKEIYNKMNYPYKYCGLLYGKPGTGKTSTILAIASELNFNIRYISMTDANIKDLLEALNGDYVGRTIFVIEDIDAVDSKMNTNRDGDDKINNAKREEVSLSDFLNVTDGLLSSDGLILLFTTNHIEKLDEAFLRSGRMNFKVEFNNLNSKTANRMINTHLGFEVENLKNEIKPTELQDAILGVKMGIMTKEDLIYKFTNKE